MTMEITLDPQADALYIKVRDGKFAKNKVIDDDTILDYDSKGHLLGIEILSASKWISSKDLSYIKVNPPLKAKA